MNRIFTDNMVLQQHTAVPVWGWAGEGEKVTVRFNGQEQSTIAREPDGYWIVRLESMNACTNPLTMKISAASGSKTIKNILIGEVWLCVGGYNMDLKLNKVYNGQEEAVAAQYPLIRFINTKVNWHGMPQPYVPGNVPWRICSAANAGEISAIGYFFSREIYTRLNVPVGLICILAANRYILSLVPTSGFDGLSELDECQDTRENAENEYFQGVVNKLAAIEQWVKNAKESRNAGQPVPKFKISVPFIRVEQLAPSLYFNGMAAQYVPFAVRGMLWYQDKPDNRLGAKFSEYVKMQALINGWRKEWQQGDFPFLFCQAAPYCYGSDHLMALWEAQNKILKTVPNTGMAATVDIANDPTVFTPLNKLDAGKRLAAIALSKTYGIKEIAYKNPSFKSVRQENGKLIISINDPGSGLKTKDGKQVREFKIAGSDGMFIDAYAEINCNEIIVWNDKVKEPVALKYAWHERCFPNLINNESLPLLPFIYPENRLSRKQSSTH